jgi:oligopeptide transport system ATP-binding protein
MSDVLLEVRNLKTYFPVVSGAVIPRKVNEIRAVDDVSFTILRGETLGLVGESGSGKTTLGLSLLELSKPTSGEIIYSGKNLSVLSSRDMRAMRRKMQMIFQDPYGSLDPRMTASDIISEAFKIHRLKPAGGAAKRVAELMHLVGLSASLANHYPHEFSAGQRQRLGIARALAVDPEFIVCDEPVSSLDVSIQAQIVQLLKELQASLHLTYLFISHDLAVVGYVSDRIAVMYLGKLFETGTREQVYKNPLHPYTKALFSAVPIPDREAEKKRQRMALKGDVPSILNPPSGCSFHPRCPFVMPVCPEKVPPLDPVEQDHRAACWLYF